ncbi:MAG: hypothetical protein ABI855_16525 [Bacteroidota bacterium]
MNLLKKWGWFFLMVMPGVVLSQYKMSVTDSLEMENLKKIFPGIGVQSDNWIKFLLLKKNGDTSIVYNEYRFTSPAMTDCPLNITLNRYIFKKEISFGGIRFKGLDFSDCVFEGNFNMSICNSWLQINRCKFYTPIKFYVDSINNLICSDNEWNYNLTFFACPFYNEFQFLNNKIHGLLTFEACKFDSRNIGFRSNQVSEIFFLNCELPDQFYLYGMMPPNSKISFVNCSAKSKKPILIDLTGCDLNNVTMDYQNFKINFENTATSSENKQQACLNLLENFKKNGQIEDYKLLDLDGFVA